MTDDSVFCMECGARLDADVPPAVPPMGFPGTPDPGNMPGGTAGRVCHICGAALDDDAFFCCVCGNRCEEPVPTVPAPDPAPHVIPEPVSAAAAGKRVCPACGAAVDDDSKFCSNCGRVFEEILRRCPHCNAIVAPGSNICAVCGKPVDTGTGSGKAEEISEPVCAPAAEPEPEVSVTNNGITEKELRAAERNFHKPPKL